MQKYHCYEKGTGYYICTLYTYTDVLNLQLFLKEKGTDLFTEDRKLSKKEAKKIFGLRKE
jgi:hypothetical protein